MTRPNPPAGRGWWHRFRSVLKPRRIVQVVVFGTLASLAFITTYIEPQSSLLRVLFGLVAATLLFTQAPVLLGSLWRRRPLAGAERPAKPADSPAARRPEPGPGIRSRVRTRWPRLSGWLPGFRPRPPADLPERLPTFRGRATELSELAQALRSRPDPAPRSRPDPAPPAGSGRPAGGSARPTVVQIVGMPGVGKSVLAQEAAHQMADQYPHGQLYANLGIGGTGRPAGEVLKEFLIALGWPEGAIPSDPETRGKIYRSLTQHRRILVVLDAARDYSQVKELLPPGPRQAVIVTSRRDLGPELGAVTVSLAPLGTADALAMVRAITGTGPGDEPMHVASIVRRCGRLPRALWAAAALVTKGQRQLAAVDRRLGADTEILAELTYDGVNLRADFQAEYQPLLAREQQALRLLTLVESPTFVPWVLCPLLDVDMSEAENLVTRLGAAHLLEVAGPSALSGTARYCFHPLVRRFARAKRDEVDARRAVTRAREQLHAAYRGVAREILHRIGEPVPDLEPQATRWLPPTSILDQIAENPEWWVRTEHANLIQCVSRAADGDRGLCWRVARWLGESVPTGADPAVIADALAAGRIAAEQEQSSEGVLGVQLAIAGLKVATDRHAEAAELLEATVTEAAHEQLPAVAAVGHRRHAEAYLQAGSFAHAAEALRSARQFAALAYRGADPPSRAVLDGSGESMLIFLLEHMCQAFQEPLRWQAGPPGEPLPAWHDRARFQAQLVRAEAAWRGGDWQLAASELAEALEASRDDCGRVATIEYQQARLCLAQVRAADHPEWRVSNGLRAVERAAEALLTFRDMGNKVGEVRARCLLTRALVAAGHLEGATHHGERALAAYRTVAPAAGPVTAELLHAAIDQANGEVRLRPGPGWIPRQRDPLSRMLTSAQWLVRRRSPDDHHPPSRHPSSGPAPSAPGSSGHPPSGWDRPPAARPGEAVQLFRHAGSIFHRHGDWWAAADCRLWLGRAYLQAGELSAAMAALWRARHAFQAAGDRTGCRLSVTELIHTAQGLGLPGMAADLRKALEQL